MFIICLDAGHGGSDPGAVGFGRKEKDDVLALTLKVGKKLTDKYIVDVRYTRTTDVFVGLKERSNISDRNSANFFISFHENAFNRQAKGFESFSYLGAHVSTKAAQKTIHNKVMAVLTKHGVINRGMKEANLSVVRECKASALLFETLFIDNAADSALQSNPTVMEAVANAYVEGIAEAFNLALKPVPVAPKPAAPTQPAGTIYRVQVGAFGVRENAERLANELKAKGYSVIITS